MKKQTFIKGSVILMLSAVVAKALGALFKIPLTNILGGVGMSYFSTAYSLFMPVYALTVTGLSSAVARMTAQSTALGMYRNAKRVRATALMLFSALGLGGSLLIVITARPFCIITAGSPEAVPAVALIAPAVFFSCITAVERGYYEGLSNMYPTALSQLAEGVIKALAGLYLCNYVIDNSQKVLAYFPVGTDIRLMASTAGILGVTLSTVGATLFFAVMRLFEKSSSDFGGESHLISRRKIARELVAFALPTGVSAVVTNLTSLIDMGTLMGCISEFGIKTQTALTGVTKEELPRFIYGSFSGIALTVFNLVPSVTNMLGKGVLPAVTQAWESKDRDALQQRITQGLFTTAVIAVPSAIGMGVLSQEILTFLFPKQTDEVAICIDALRILMPGMVCLCLSYPVFSMLQGIGKAGTPLKIMIVGAVIKLAGNIAFIPFMGINGASLSTSLCYIAVFTASLRVLYKQTKLRLKPASLLPVIYSGSVCGAFAYIISDILELKGAENITVLLVTIPLSGVIYILTLLYSSGNIAPINCRSATESEKNNKRLSVS